MKKPRLELTTEAVTERFRALAEKYRVRDNITINDVKRRIYEAGDVNFQNESHKYFEWAMGIFPEAKDIDAMNEVMELCSGAWNVFPHKALDGKAPVDLLDDNKMSRMTRASENMTEVFAESIKDLYAMARTRAQKEFKRVGGTPQEFTTLENALGKKDVEENAMLLSLISIGRRKDYKGTEWFEPFVREYQAMTNHCTLPGMDGFIGSFYLFEVLQAAPEMKRSPAQVFHMIDCTLDSHQAIDECGKKLKLPIHMTSIAHHAFDWLMMTRPTDMMLDVPQTNALIIYAIVTRIQKIVRGDDYEISEGKFTKYIYPDEHEVFIGRVSELVPILLCEVIDPHMLLVDAEGAPDDWFARMKRLAPDMQDHFKEKIPAGSIPSPFYPM